jgi:SHS2 domain-containing protein
MRPYDILDHTADIGLVIYGKDLPELFVHAGRGFSDMITEVTELPAALKKTITVKGQGAEDLLIAFLKELLFLFDTEQLLFSKFTIEKLDDTELSCQAEGDELDTQKYAFKTGLKAVTHHMLKVEKVKEGYRATVIFDV